jgi:cell wall-active antibiotic response 4TMS protein YvqF
MVGGDFTRDSPFTGPATVFAGNKEERLEDHRILEASASARRRMTTHDDAHRPEAGAILVGLVIMFVGLSMLVDRTGIARIYLTGRFWPFVLIAFGCARLLASSPRAGRRRRSTWSGVWFIYLGLWFFINEFHVMGFWYTSSWPLLIVGAGIGMIWRAIEHPGRSVSDRIEESR